MSIVYHRTSDMFIMEKVMDYFVNPTTLRGDMDKGIGLEFVKRFPSLKTEYFRAIDDRSLFIGELQILEDSTIPYKIINLPLKESFMEKNNPDNLRKALEALRDKFLHEKDVHITMPLLGQDWENDYCAGVPLFTEMLGDTDAIFHVCIHPKKTDMNPKYLVIYGDDIKHYSKDAEEYLSNLIKNSLSSWKLELKDFDKIITIPPFEQMGKLISPNLKSCDNVLYYGLAPRVLPEYYRMNLMFCSGSHFVILDKPKMRISHAIMKFYKMFDDYNDKLENDSIDRKFVSNNFYKEKLKQYKKALSCDDKLI